MLKRLKGLVASESEILDVYMKQVRSVLELIVPVWQPAITKQEIKQIGRVQRCALYIILGENYSNYEDAMDLMECESLNERIDSLCNKSARHPSYFFLNMCKYRSPLKYLNKGK